MKKELIYDFHTHIDDMEIFERYYEDNIIPVVNCQNDEEYYRLKDRIEKLKIDRGFSDDKFHFSVGIHPNDSWKYEEDINQTYIDIVKKSPIIGEIGMDGKWCDVSFDIQEKVFVKSLELAKETNKTVILHTKDMEEKIYNIIKDYDLDFVIHWYSCDKFLKEYIEKGCYFTIGPAILNDENVMYLVKIVPIDRILIETDGLDALEWLFNRHYTVDNIRGMLDSVVEEISLIKGINIDETYDILRRNSERLLNKKINC